MNRELTPEEEQELSELSRQLVRTAPPITEEMQRYYELDEKKYGTKEEQAEEIRQNRKNFFALQEKLSKKVTK
ncbi:hypothetical protein [Anaerococcus degeneri]|uniref:Uncharacterized protein n=1 Tax=Anaerococcus degeneri TaxID=361500 RepID=A0ABS7YYD9_9FIRM|nr:hypothetical protein [Anaerococcus degeneri]MBP2016147.1 hypothetical protein [Anaerococcus degeneri]MCA2096648.1 hypothetical protein [Anaerococcus degeneri]